MKQQDTTMKKIGDVNYYITPFSAFLSARIGLDLSRTLAPFLNILSPLFSSSDTIGEDTSIGDLDLDEIIPPLAEALMQLETDDFERLMRELIINHENVSYEIDGEVHRLNYDAANEIFCGELIDMLTLCIEVIRLNFGGFFTKMFTQFGSQDGFMGQVTTQTAKTGTKSTGRSTSKGSAN